MKFRKKRAIPATPTQDAPIVWQCRVGRHALARGTFVVRMGQELNIFRRGVTNGYLNRIPIIAGLRLAPVVVMGLSWLVLVNHCELAAATAPKPAQTHSCCEKNNVGDKPPLKDDQHKSIECCKGGHPAISPIAKKTLNRDFSLIAHLYVIALVPFPDGSSATAVPELGTGPPFAGSFAEVVLQRSILAHAPPYLV